MSLYSFAPAADVSAWPGEAPPPGAFSQMLSGLWDFLVHITGAEYLFFFFALLAVLCAAVTVSHRNPVVSAVWLVGSFFCVAICYVMLSATFLAALQVLVYAGAMMVLFVFVVMVLDVDERGATNQPSTRKSRRWPYFGAIVVLVTGATWVLWGTLTRQFHTPGRAIGTDFGTAESVGRELFGPALFAFEGVSLLLLAAVIGAVVVARSRRERVKEALASGVSGEGLHVAGLGSADDDPGTPELTDAQVRQPFPVMDFGQPSAGGHEGGN
ncbi:MAG: NADH-quinone oxidoreductase subunit J [Nannocystaceae bacterium]|nr:NADH-quinone oxidoreductase subunit J [Nannocystaceae bacterium]